MIQGEKLIRHYNRLNGNSISAAKLKEFHTELQRFLDSNGHGPLVPQIKGIYERIGKGLRDNAEVEFFAKLTLEPIEYHPPIGIRDIARLGKPKKSTVKQSTVNSRPKKKSKTRVEKVSKPVAENKSAVKATKPTHQQKPAVAVSGVETFKKSSVNKKAPSTQSGVNYSYKVVELGNYKKDFHRMYSDTIVQIHGMPGHGKTVYLLKKAQYRAAHTNDNVLYVAREEYGRSVFDMKLKEHNIGHKNLRFCKTLTPQDLKWATVIFLDSVTALKLTHEDVENLADQYPNRNWFVVLQSTKGGDFRGSQEWEHLVDIAGEVRNRKMILTKNRLDPDNSKKREKLLTDDAIQEAKKKKVIREAVKDAQPKEVEESKKIAA